ncbi:flagellar hook assembly protein FlgD [Psychrobacillus sp.]|uniref:flagellar hook assembly protein FlgD n=1 Tax=Psychrobacillus sp. TaxID=1871623 RepID=UPI0028BE8749|nr:flagellar hook assembly protein FlgD [Psychrobacillus sp.]
MATSDSVKNKPITDDMYLTNKKQPVRKPGSDLGKDEFLKILMTQLQNQDPSNPMEDKDFIAQMAQFSSLEQMMNMTKAFESFAAGQQQTQLIQYNTFVGKQIKWHEVTDKKDSKNQPIINEGTGTIASVRFVEGGVEFTLTDGKKINPGNISEVLSGGSSGSNSLVDASMMIGKTVSYIPVKPEEDKDKKTEDDKDTKPETKEAKVDSVSKKDGVIVYNLSDGTTITADQITSIS